MTELLPTVAIGFALVDHKLHAPEPLPSPEHGAMDEYLLQQSLVATCAGGSVANTVNAFNRYSRLPTRLYYQIAEDDRGSLFARQTHARLGQPQIASEGHTGMCILDLDSDGFVKDEITYYGVARAVTIPKHEWSDMRNGLVISNVNTLRTSSVHEQTVRLLEKLDRRRGMFAFRLSGAHSLLATSQQAQAVLDSLPRTPDIVFGNSTEVTDITGDANEEQALKTVLPDSRIFIMTRGSRETLIRYEGVVSRLATISVKKVVDVTGGGDHFMGVTLGELMEIGQKNWSKEKLVHAATMGSRASAMVVQSTQSRLTSAQLESHNLLAGRTVYGRD